MKRMKPDTNRVVGNDGSVKYFDTRNGNQRKRWWTKARIPGEIRESRKPGGSGFRNNWEGGWTDDWYENNFVRNENKRYANEVRIGLNSQHDSHVRAYERR